MKALTLALSALILAGCPAKPVSTPSRGALDLHPWAGIADNCQRADGRVCCDEPYFKGEHSLSIEHFAAALDFSRRWELCEDRRDLARDSADSRIADCKMKLNSPWRSPWLWGVIGLVAGIATGAGIFAGSSR